MATIKEAGAPPVKADGAQKSKWPRRGDPFVELRIEDCKPYKGRDELQSGRVEAGDPVVNDRGERIGSGKPVVMCGEPRFYLEQTRYGWINLIGIYHKGNSVGTRNIRTLKVKQVSPGAPKSNVERQERDTAILKQLRGQGLPTFQAGENP